MGFASLYPSYTKLWRSARRRNPSPLAEIGSIVSTIARPILRINSKSNQAVESRIWPRVDLRHMAMLDRIEVNVVDVTLEVVLIAERMLPIAPLPNAPFTLIGSAWRYLFPSRQTTRERRLDQSPAGREIRVTLRQRPYRVQMIRQHHRCFRRIRMPSLRVAKGTTQQFDVVREQSQSPVRQIDGEKITAAGKKITPIIGHRNTEKSRAMGFASLYPSYTITSRRARRMGRAQRNPSPLSIGIGHQRLFGLLLHSIVPIATTRTKKPRPRWVSLRSTHPTGLVRYFSGTLNNSSTWSFVSGADRYLSVTASAMMASRPQILSGSAFSFGTKSSRVCSATASEMPAHLA